MSFLDRVNIGAAKLYGFMDDLNLSSHQYTIASMIFVSPPAANTEVQR